jgi:hypothetical protein
LAKEAIDCPKWAVDRLHKDTPLEINHHYLPSGQIAPAGKLRGIIQRAQDREFSIEIWDDLFVMPDMIS